jgi:outer membrane protein assembly factor BamB
MRTSLAALVLTAALALNLHAADWPMWKHDSGRTAVSPDPLPSELHLQWVRELPRARQAWKDKSNFMLFFDVSYEPIVAGKLMFVGSMNSDSVTAYDTETGAEKWRFYTDGPVRFAPVAYKGKLYAGSDDGHLYCLDAEKGTLIWKLRGGPANNRIIGNQRLIGMWPVRGAPVIHNDTLYYAAGLWPFMGTFIYALEPATGNVIWANTGSGSQWLVQPHGAPSFAGVSPQGYLVATDSKLLIPSSRGAPGAYDRQTGKFLYCEAPDKNAGGYAVTAAGGKFANRLCAYDLSDGRKVVCHNRLLNTVWAPDEIYSVQGDKVSVFAYTGKELPRTSEAKLDQTVGRAYIKAGDALYCARDDGTVSAVSVADPKAPSVTWQGKVEGKVWNMLAADDRLFVIGEDGKISCFGAGKGDAIRHVFKVSPQSAGAGTLSSGARVLMANCGDPTGYCVVIGIGNGALASELAFRSKLNVIAVDEDADKINAFRMRMDKAGLYGSRVAAYVADPLNSGLPPYLAHAMVGQNLPGIGKAQLARLFNTLRPYGGVALLPLDRERLKGVRLRNAKAARVGNLIMLRRVGALAGAAPWTHQYADAANTVISKDKLVKPPFGLLWFGGPTNDEILPRHGHGPNPEVIGGRLFIEGEHMLRAVDVYNGRVLWEKQSRDIGHYYRHTGHEPGANEVGSNYVCTEDAVYLMAVNKCMVLDPATGKTVKEFTMSAGDDGEVPKWGSLRIWDRYLVATASPLNIPLSDKKGKVVKNADYSSASKTLVVMDRHTGEQLWTREAKHGFRHNAVIAASNMVFCLDKLSEKKIAFFERRGMEIPEGAAILALDIRSGKTAWQSNTNVFGTWLAYSSEHDVLVQGGSAYRDRASDDIGKGLIAYRGKDGSVLWQDLERGYSGPPMLRHRELITNGEGGEAFDLFTGKSTGWKWKRKYGCNTAIGGEHVLTFRSGAAGYYDATHKGGTGNLGGFKSGCSSSLIPADGLLNAPDYTRTCTCAYQNQTSLALVHMPQAEMWTFGAAETAGRLGINFGAPGDRVSETGTLWSEFPSAGSPDAKRQVKTDGTPFRHHSALFSGEAETWIASSGVEGLSELSINPPGKGACTVRLYFAEPDVNAKPGSRVFNVSLGNEQVLNELDIVQEAGAPRTVLVKEFKGIKIDTALGLSFSGVKGQPLICGVEILADHE